MHNHEAGTILSYRYKKLDDNNTDTILILSALQNLCKIMVLHGGETYYLAHNFLHKYYYDPLNESPLDSNNNPSSCAHDNLVYVITEWADKDNVPIVLGDLDQEGEVYGREGRDRLYGGTYYFYTHDTKQPTNQNR